MSCVDWGIIVANITLLLALQSSFCSNIFSASQSDREVMLWDIDKHVHKKTIQGLGQCTATYFCLRDSCIVVEMEQTVRVIDVETGRMPVFCSIMALKVLYYIVRENVSCVFLFKKYIN